MVHSVKNSLDIWKGMQVVSLGGTLYEAEVCSFAERFSTKTVSNRKGLDYMNVVEDICWDGDSEVRNF